jgi:hypothetical protein
VVGVVRGIRRQVAFLAIMAVFSAVGSGSTVLASGFQSTSADSCTVHSLDMAAGLGAGVGFTRTECADGWALAVGTQGPRAAAGLFHLEDGRWAEVKVTPTGGTGEASLEFAPVGTGIGAPLLRSLARPFGLPVQQVVDAGSLVEGLAGREASLKAVGAYQASPLLSVDGRTWLVLEGADAADDLNPSLTASPYPDGTVWIYRWTATGWTEQGTVRGWLGPIGGCCGIGASSFTGSHDPDFFLAGGGAADTNWLAVVSDVGGRWHAVPFDYGYSDTTVVNGEPSGRGVFTAVDASSSADGPTTTLFETYQDGAFQPHLPPGRIPPCSLSALQVAADPGQLAVLEFSEFACADGWAMAIGTGAGYSDQVVGLFEAQGSTWRTVEVDNGDSLGSDPGIYDIPLSLLRRLTASFGAGVQPDMATAALIAQPAMAGALYLNGVIGADGADWYVVERPTGNADSPDADAVIYRWSGKAWVEQGEVDHVPPSLNYFRATSGGWFGAVSIPGSADPGFRMQGASPPATAVLSDYGGAWHVAS